MLSPSQNQLSITTKYQLPHPYSTDIWDICSWDIFRQASESAQNNWLRRSNVLNNELDFTIIEAPLVREELKAFLYYLILKDCSLTTIADYTDRIKTLSKYINNYDINSVFNIDLNSYSIYLLATKHKLVVNNGCMVIDNSLVKSTRKNRNITFIIYLQQTLDRIYNTYSLKSSDLWNGKSLHPEELYPRNLDFRMIKNTSMKKALKEYIWIKLSSVTTKTCANYIVSANRLCQWIESTHCEITSFNQLSRDLIEEYFIYLRTETNHSDHLINLDILNLCKIFEYGYCLNHPDFPSTPLVLPNDYSFKKTTGAEFYSFNEIRTMFNCVRTLPKIYGRILLVLHHTGMRISEILNMKQDSLTETNGKYYLSIFMYKKNKYNQIPINELTYNLIKKETLFTHSNHKDSSFVFVNKNGSPIGYTHFIQNIKKALILGDALDDYGRPLKFRTHKFRATKATNLISMGADPYLVSSMLGQDNINSLAYYVSSNEMNLQDEMKDYLSKQSFLIQSIGKHLSNSDIANDLIPLCNGFCSRPKELGLCTKANVCLHCSLFRPSKKFILNYKSQLSNIESSLEIANQNNWKRLEETLTLEKTSLEKIIKELEVQN